MDVVSFLAVPNLGSFFFPLFENLKVCEKFFLFGFPRKLVKMVDEKM